MIKNLIYAISVLLILLFNVLYTKYEIRNSIKVVNVNAVIDEYKANLFKEYQQGTLTEDGVVKLTSEFIVSLEATLKQHDGIILISQAVLSGGKDVTQQIKTDIKY
ncbi:MAG: TrbI F-type domain-containing protein [Deferribacteraceae bacterium]|jgi:molybdopterin converting factor small subunit|nr:TrbI F-type domain-containing protein [Deferribacteraceae bacterium]